LFETDFVIVLVVALVSEEDAFALAAASILAKDEFERAKSIEELLP
jgi:hypothetical protein